jgi:TrmH family RNA methyltransferase
MAGLQDGRISIVQFNPAILPYCNPAMSPTEITSRHNPLVARYRAAVRGDADVVLLDGAHLVGDALRAGVAVQHAATTAAVQARADVGSLLAALAGAGAEIATVSENVMDALSPVRSSSGVVALAARPVHALERVYAGDAPLVVVAVDVQDPGNLGAIARVAEAGGATGMVAAGASADPFGWKALRGSMGSSLRLPVATATADAALAAARRRGCSVVAAAPRDGRPLYDVALKGPLVILIGGEGQGLSPAVADAADERITIPMQAPVESLNTAVAAALIVYEARRQRMGSATKTQRHEG